VDIKNNKYTYNDEVSFEKRRLFGRSLIRGIVISYRYVNYNWVYLVECIKDKKLVVVPEDELWLLKMNESNQAG
jgi:hypothetical protein